MKINDEEKTIDEREEGVKNLAELVDQWVGKDSEHNSGLILLADHNEETGKRDSYIAAFGDKTGLAAHIAWLFLNDEKFRILVEESLEYVLLWRHEERKEGQSDEPGGSDEQE